MVTIRFRGVKLPSICPTWCHLCHGFRILRNYCLQSNFSEVFCAEEDSQPQSQAKQRLSQNFNHKFCFTVFCASWFAKHAQLAASVFRIGFHLRETPLANEGSSLRASLRARRGPCKLTHSTINIDILRRQDLCLSCSNPNKSENPSITWYDTFEYWVAVCMLKTLNCTLYNLYHLILFYPRTNHESWHMIYRTWHKGQLYELSGCAAAPPHIASLPRCRWRRCCYICYLYIQGPNWLGSTKDYLPQAATGVTSLQSFKSTWSLDNWTSLNKWDTSNQMQLTNQIWILINCICVCL